MSPECRRIIWGDEAFGTPRPDKVQTYYPSTEVVLKRYPGLDNVLREEFGEEQFVAVFGYGSSFNGESTTSLVDFILIVDNPFEFHRQNRNRKPGDYDPITGYPGLQTWLNRFSPNYYQSQISIDGQLKNIKYGVLGFDDFLIQARSGLRGSEGVAHLYTAGRLHKVGIYPLLMADDVERRAEIDLAINQARIDGVWLALGLLPDYFDYDSFIHTYVGLSYTADVRAEKGNKVDLLIQQSQEDYAQMTGDLLRLFVDCDVLEGSIEGGFRKKISLGEREVKNWLAESAWYAFRVNYFKNPFTYGPVKALQYGIAKVDRAMTGTVDKPEITFHQDGRILIKPPSRRFVVSTAQDLVSRNPIASYVLKLPEDRRTVAERRFGWLLGENYDRAKSILATIDSKEPLADEENS